MTTISAGQKKAGSCNRNGRAHMSPNRFSVSTTPLSLRGLETMNIAAESTRWCSSQDVSLVYRVNRKRRVGRDSDLRCHARYALDLLDTINHSIPRYVLLRRYVLLFALAKVDAPDELAHDDDVDADGDGFFQWRVDDERV